MAEVTNAFTNSQHRSIFKLEQLSQQLTIIDVSELSPLASSTSKGNQDKWYDHKNRLFIKKAFNYQNKVWKDYLCEQVAVKIGTQLGMVLANTFPCVIYDHGKPSIGSASVSFLHLEEEFIAFYRALLRAEVDYTVKSYQSRSTSERIAFITQIYAQQFSLDASQYLFEMIYLDFLIGNEDRHFNNFGVIRTSNGFRLAPHFDNGLSLFEHDTRYLGMPLDVCIRKMSGKPFNSDLKKAYLAAKEVFSDCKLSTDRISLDGIMFPSNKAIEYIKYAAKEMGLTVTGEGIVIDD